MSVTVQGSASTNVHTRSRIIVRDAGFTTLHTGGDRPELDIVLIHGIQGHPIDTWTYPQVELKPPKWKGILGMGRSRSTTPVGDSRPGTPPDVPLGMWPANLLSKDFKTARILTYGYDSQASNFFGGGANKNDMITIANGFLNDIANMRVDARGRPLLIVSHSMGGLITKEALRRASVAPAKDADLKDVLDSTFAVMFFGTPHRGGAYTNLGLTATKMAKAAGFSVNDRNIRDLKGTSPVLTLIREGFVQLLDSNKFEVSTFQESLGYSGFGPLDDKVVPNESSEIGHGNERKNFINANHMNMCRFKDEHDDGYLKTRGEIKRHLARLQSRIQESQDRLLAQRCTDSFRIPQMDTRVLQIDSAYGETLKWLYEDPGPGIAEWFRSGTGVFWIQGKPGSGKSTAMKFLLQNEITRRLLNNSASSGAWLLIGTFFTNRAERIQSSWRGILHSMIYQLLQHCPSLTGIAQAAFIKQNGRAWDMGALEQLLLAFKSRFDKELRVCFLVDALDEHDGQNGRMGDFFHNLVAAPSDYVHIKVCVASRPHNDLKDLFDKDPTFKMQDWTMGDIMEYMAGRLSQQPRWRAFTSNGNSSIVREVRDDIAERAQGVFLWVRLVIDLLIEGIRDGLSLSELKDEVSKFPDDLEDFFDHMLQRVQDKYRMELIIIVETLLRSLASPSLEFILLVIFANTESPSITTNVVSQDTEGFIRRLQSRCGGLVEIVPAEAQPIGAGSSRKFTVQFLHQTVKEYFLERKKVEGFLQSVSYLAPGVDHPNGHFFILQAYIHWLRMRPAERYCSDISITGLQSDIIYHASRIELTLHVSAKGLLDSLDLLMSRQCSAGMLWSIQFKKELIFPLLDSPKVIRQGQGLLITAVSYGLGQYMAETFDDGMVISVRESGVIQFGYLPCHVGVLQPSPLLKGAELLLISGVDVATCHTFEFRDLKVSLDALGVFTTSHSLCSFSDDEKDRGGHTKVFARLLELGANPCGYFVTKTDSILAAESHRIAEHFLRPHIHTDATCTRSLELLWERCRLRSLTVGALFGTQSDRVFDLPVMDELDSEDVLKWLFDHGALISETAINKIYEPLRMGFMHKFGTVKSYSEVVESYRGRGLSQWEMLEPSLVNTFLYELDGTIRPCYRSLLRKEFRRPHYYDAAARRLASNFNPEWGNAEFEDATTTFRQGFWRSWFPHFGQQR